MRPSHAGLCCEDNRCLWRFVALRGGQTPMHAAHQIRSHIELPEVLSMKSSTTLALFLLLLCGSWMLAQDTNSSAGQTGSSGSSAGQSSGSNAGQNTGAAGSSNQSGSNQSGSNTSSGGTASSRRGGANNNSRNLPKTATPIPLIGALGLEIGR